MPKELLKESSNRDQKFMLLGTRREGGQMAPVLFAGDRAAADAARAALKTTGWFRVEIWTKTEDVAAK